MAESLTKYKSVAEIAAIYGMTAKTVRELCQARGAKFAFKLKPGGRYYIDQKQFRNFIERKRREG